MSKEQKTILDELVGKKGDIVWITLIVGIVLIIIGYWI
jgi:flagellar basal body-associated protein FliL